MIRFINPVQTLENGREPELNELFAAPLQTIVWDDADKVLKSATPLTDDAIYDLQIGNKNTVATSGEYYSYNISHEYVQFFVDLHKRLSALQNEAIVYLKFDTLEDVTLNGIYYDLSNTSSIEVAMSKINIDTATNKAMIKILVGPEIYNQELAPSLIIQQSSGDPQMIIFDEPSKTGNGYSYILDGNVITVTLSNIGNATQLSFHPTSTSQRLILL